MWLCSVSVKIECDMLLLFVGQRQFLSFPSATKNSVEATVVRCLRTPRNRPRLENPKINTE